MIHAISVLLGLNPAELTDELNSGGAIPASPPSIPTGLPSDLLRRRPDVRQSERNLAATVARIGVQVSSLFPSITLPLSMAGNRVVH